MRVEIFKIAFIKLTILIVPLATLMLGTSGTSAQEVPTRLESAKASKVKYSGVITGTVTATDGRPLPGATVSLFGPFAKSTDGNSDSVLSPFASVRTNMSGQFHSKNLPPGVWRLECGAKGYFQHPDYVESDDHNIRFSKTPLTAVIEAHDISNPAPMSAVVQIVMRRSAVLYGRILDSDGRLVTNRRFCLIRVEDHNLPTRYYNVSTDGQGFFKLEFRIPPPRRLVPAKTTEEKQGEEQDATGDQEVKDWLALFVPGLSGYGPYLQFTLRNGKQTRLDFQLLRGATLSGTVFGSDGKTPAAGVTVSAVQSSVSSDGLSWKTLPFTVRETREPGPEGSLSVGMLVTGDNVEGKITNRVTDAQGHYAITVSPGIRCFLSVGIPKPYGLKSVDFKEQTILLHDEEHRVGLDLILK